MGVLTIPVLQYSPVLSTLSAAFVFLYLNLRRSRHCFCFYLSVCLCFSYTLHLLLLASCYAMHINALGSFRVNSINGSQVSVSNIAPKIPKITLVSIMKACQILGCNSEYFWRYSLSNFLFCIAFLPSRLRLPLKYHIYIFYTDIGLKLAILTNSNPVFHILLSE